MKKGPIGSGIAASKLPLELQRGLDNMKDQLIILLIERLGGTVEIPIVEIDKATIGKGMGMTVNRETGSFIFKVGKMS